MPQTRSKNSTVPFRVGLQMFPSIESLAPHDRALPSACILSYHVYSIAFNKDPVVLIRIISNCQWPVTKLLQLPMTWTRVRVRTPPHHPQFTWSKTLYNCLVVLNSSTLKHGFGVKLSQVSKSACLSSSYHSVSFREVTSNRRGTAGQSCAMGFLQPDSSRRKRRGRTSPP